MRESDTTYHKGQIFRHNVQKCRRSKNTVFLIVDSTIYVDDTAVPFTSREERCKVMPLIQLIFADPRMEIHMGKWTEKTNDATGAIKKAVERIQRASITTKHQRLHEQHHSGLSNMVPNK